VITTVLMVGPWMASMGSAQDVLVLDKDAPTLISGVITEVDLDSFKLRSSDSIIEVSMKEMQTEVNAEKILAPGMEVTVEGAFDNNIFEAERVAKVSEE
jgi:hypothetical protein